ncbi:MAG: Nif3-like dinuclear metal center hexameric protein [Clostridia bacterium]|nr:Nif3-like dinuclear metal center hexameric protein [Clostridia bacterium]
MIRVSKILEELEIIAPLELQCNWDNSGLLVGDESQRVEKVFVCLDITSENVKSAVDFGADLIISHHPLIFDPIKSITEATVTGSVIRTLIKNNISVFCMHTCFDIADGGMNDLLAAKLGLESVRKFTLDECIDENGQPLDGIGRVGALALPKTLADFMLHIKEVLGSAALKYSGNPNEIVQTVAICAGSGGSEMYAAYHSGAEVYVTSDLKHDHGRVASEIGLNVVDAGHFETENIICDFFEDFFASRFPEIKLEISDAQPYFKSI